MALLNGYEIQHKTLRNCVATVPLSWRKMPPNPDYGIDGRCPTCMVLHTVKTYHLYVDDAGRCVVSERVFDNLCKAGAIDGVPQAYLRFRSGKHRRLLVVSPFEFVQRVEPPPLTIGLGSANSVGTVVIDGEGKVLYRPRMRVINMHTDQGA